MADLVNSKTPETVENKSRFGVNNSTAKESGYKDQRCTHSNLNELCLPKTNKSILLKPAPEMELQTADITSDAALASRAAHPVARITNTIAHTARIIGRASATVSLLSKTFTRASIEKKNKILAKVVKVSKWLGPAEIMVGAAAESAIDPSLRGATKTAATLGVGFASLKLGGIALAALEASLLVPGATIVPAVGGVLLGAAVVAAVGIGAWSLTTMAIDKAFDSKLFKK